MARKPKYAIVLDVETSNVSNDPHVYDMGYAVIDGKGNIVKECSYVISPVFFDRFKQGEFKINPEMHSAYYAEKIPQYVIDLKRGKRQLAMFSDARKSLLNDMRTYKIDTVLAYNANFDINALNNTMRYLSNGRYQWFFPYGTNVQCIWHMATQVICTTRKYYAFCKKHGFYSEKGNIKTDAETVYKFLSDSVNFAESHTGLEDVRIETEIFKACLKKHKKMDRAVRRDCWRIPQAKWKEFLKRVEG